MYPKQLYFVFLKNEEQDYSSLSAIFLNLVFCGWQLRKNERDCGGGGDYKFNVCTMYVLAIGSALERSAV